MADNKRYWKSLKEYNNSDSVLELKKNEFKNGVTEEFSPDEMSGISRRKFIALLSASAAFAATACTDYQDKGEIIPYNNRPEGMLPGKANYYASTTDEGAGILVKTREGRPIKIDGNPDHPVNSGKITAIDQSRILNLYDPERLAYPKSGGLKSSWMHIDEKIKTALAKAAEENKEIALVSHPVNSPSLKRLLQEFADKYPGFRHYTYEFIGNKNRLQSFKESYNLDIIPAIKFDQAKVILSVDSDFIGKEANSMEYSRLFANAKNIVDGENVCRLYVAEAGMSLTGANADYRIKLRGDARLEFVKALYRELGGTGFGGPTLSGVTEKYSIDENKIKLLVKDLQANKGASIVYAGDTASVDVHNVVNAINDLLGNTILYNFETGFAPVKYSSKDDLKNLIADMNSGKVEVVINLDSNPAFHLPEDSGFVEAFGKVPESISLVEAENETSKISKMVVPVNNLLESWGDIYARRSLYSLRQPVIAPLFDTRQKEAVLLKWLSGKENFDPNDYKEYMSQTLKTKVYDVISSGLSFQNFWYKALHDGFVKINHRNVVMPSINKIQVSDWKGNPGNYELVLSGSYFIGDGRFANNGWLQELPHPVTKVTWDNYAAISPATAKAINVNNNDLIKIDTGGRQLDLPVLVQPGVTEKTIAIELGYGRKTIGSVGKKVGFNANNLMSFNTPEEMNISDVKLSKTDKTYEIVSTQEHHAIDDEFVKDFHKIRGLIKEGTVEKYQKDPKLIQKQGHKIALFNVSGEEHKYEGNKWAMAIDLNKCTGCSVCVASCNVENNIPVVGKDQVEVGREMHWMRIDRYYSGTPEEPEVSIMPVLCQHCDNAPCENVCPVNATQHSPDGLNQMVYNRCVGTRYCANNCPYKVRRFNFYDFRDHFEDSYYDNELSNLVYNPEVTVRSRGVMEKCTFCVQKIMDAREEAIREGRKIRDGEITTACQQACPTEAIIFGDKNILDAKINKYREHDLSYHMLEETNVRPNVTYLAKLKNTHSEE